MNKRKQWALALSVAVLILALVETYYFGNNWWPQSPAEIVGDGICLILATIAGCLYWMPVRDPNKFEKVVSDYLLFLKYYDPNQDEKAHLLKLLGAVERISSNIDDVGQREHHEGVALMDYSGMMINLLTAAGKSGFTIQQITAGTMNRMKNLIRTHERDKV